MYTDRIPMCTCINCLLNDIILFTLIYCMLHDVSAKFFAIIWCDGNGNSSLCIFFIHFISSFAQRTRKTHWKWWTNERSGGGYAEVEKHTYVERWYDLFYYVHRIQNKLSNERHKHIGSIFLYFVSTYYVHYVCIYAISEPIVAMKFGYTNSY